MARNPALGLMTSRLLPQGSDRPIERDPHARERVLLVLRSRENERLLADALRDRYDVETGVEALPTAPFDLCILDAPSLEAHWEAVQARKAREAPAFLPFLFISMRRDVRIFTRYLYLAVDEIIQMPLVKVELEARMEILLRARRSSLALKRRGDALFTALVDQSLAGVYLAEDGPLLFANAACLKLLGAEPGELPDLDAAVDPEDLPALLEARRALLKGESEASRATLHLRGPDGEAVVCEALERRFVHEGRQVRLGLLVDVTERMHAEEVRARSQQERIEALTRADELKDQFLSIISHELRTPINAITGFGSILLDGVAGELTDRQQEYMRKLLSGAEVLLSLVNDLLDMGRIQAGKFSLAPGPMRLHEVVEGAIANLEPMASSKRVQLVDEVPSDLPEIVADSQRVSQVVVNLVANAVKFTESGGTVRIRAAVEGPALHVEVEDTGVGIAKEQFDKLFQRFAQLDMTYTRRAGGVGLGLSICKALVEAHGGTIGVQSQVGQGATFWFSLPLSGPAAS